MYIQPKSFLSRLLAAAWTIFLTALLLWFTICLLAKIWIWIVVISATVTLIGIGIWVRRLRRERW
jgi:CHASE2 domain-containing sensor protein